MVLLRYLHVSISSNVYAAIILWYLQNERKNFVKNIFYMRPKFAKSVSSEKNLYTTFSNGFSTTEWRLSINIKLPLKKIKKTWQVVLHYHSEAGDVKSTYKGLDYLRVWLPTISLQIFLLVFQPQLWTSRKICRLTEKLILPRRTHSGQIYHTPIINKLRVVRLLPSISNLHNNESSVNEIMN